MTTHLERRYFEPGNLGFPVFQFRGVRVGLSLCNDRRWPETYRMLCLNGAEVVLIGYNTPVVLEEAPALAHLRMFHNHLPMQAGAYQNTLWIAAAAKAGLEDGQALIGGSCIIAPSGEIAALATSIGDETVIHRADLGLIDVCRRVNFDFARYRRPDEYALIAGRASLRPHEHKDDAVFMNSIRRRFLAALLLAPGLAAAGVQVLNGDAQFPEGPIWYRGKLYYVEYGRNAVMVWDGQKNAVFAAEAGCGQSAVAPTARGEFVTTCYDNGSIGRMSATGAVLPAYTHDKDGRKFDGPNDLAPDGRGGIYFTTSGRRGPYIDGKVFLIAASGAITQVADDLHNANGLAVSADRRILYVVETEERRLLAFTIAPDGALLDRRVFVNLDDVTHRVAPIWPDGVKVSSKGDLYIGQSPRDLKMPLLGQIFVLSRDGKLLRTLTLPSPKVPNLAFSPDEKTIYVTAVDQIDKAPYPGKVYAIPNE